MAESKKKLITIIAGLPGAGKTELARNLSNTYGLEIRGIGDELARLYRLQNGLEPGVPVGGDERMPIHKLIRKTDPDYFARFCIEGNFSHRIIDGLRNLYDAKRIIESHDIQTTVITIEAPLPLRIARRLNDTTKDRDSDAIILREQAENNDLDINGAQATAVMGLARFHGFYINGAQSEVQVLTDVLDGFSNLSIEL